MVGTRAGVIILHNTECQLEVLTSLSKMIRLDPRSFFFFSATVCLTDRANVRFADMVNERFGYEIGIQALGI